MLAKFSQRWEISLLNFRFLVKVEWGVDESNLIQTNELHFFNIKQNTSSNVVNFGFSKIAYSSKIAFWYLWFKKLLKTTKYTEN